MSFLLSKVARWVAADARVLGGPGPTDAQGFARVDLLIDEGRIAALAPAGAQDFGETPRLPLNGRIALPCFVDAHTHLDKGHIWRRAPNPNGIDFPSAIEAVMKPTARRTGARRTWPRGWSLRFRPAPTRTARGRSARISTVVGRAGARLVPGFRSSARTLEGAASNLQASPLFGVDVTFDPGHLETIEEMVESALWLSKLLGAVTYMIPQGCARRSAALFTSGRAQRMGSGFPCR